MFAFKKIVGSLLMPLPVALLLLSLGLLLLWFTRRQAAGRVLCTVSLFVLMVSSVPAISFNLLEPIEWQDGEAAREASARTDTVKWIVVLDGGIRTDGELPLMSRLDRSTLVRLAEGLRLHRSLPEARLLLSAARSGEDDRAAVMREAAMALGADSAQIVMESRSRDTSDQAANVSPIVGDDAFVLVTSAYHMPRALYHFRRIGLDPIPLRTDHLTTGTAERGLLPTPDAVRAGAIVWREFLGGIWGRLTGD